MGFQNNGNFSLYSRDEGYARKLTENTTVTKYISKWILTKPTNNILRARI